RWRWREHPRQCLRAARPWPQRRGVRGRELEHPPRPLRRKSGRRKRQATASTAYRRVRRV
ncbi:hypothetical protein OAF65_10705, partial [Verrucomicrobiales bacterium]|nr:hypothetical protein [Verrucomicrobiales bacterium]